MPALTELEHAYAQSAARSLVSQRVPIYLREYAGRETPLYFAERLTEKLGGAKIYLKREDLCHTGAHKINNTIGQILLARRMGKAAHHRRDRRRPARRGDRDCGGALWPELRNLHGQGRRAAPVAQCLSHEACSAPRSAWSKPGSQTLKDAMNEALRDWVTNVRSTYYLIGSVAGPHPYPMMVRDFQSVIGRKRAGRFCKKKAGLPDYLWRASAAAAIRWACFYPFVRDRKVKMLGVEAAGHGLRSGKHAASIQGGAVGVLHGSKSYVLQDERGQITETHSIAAGLDYPGVGPELSYLRDCGRAQFAARHRSRSDCRDQAARRELKGLFPPWKALMPSLPWRAWRRSCQETADRSSSIFRAAAIRTC